MAEVLWSVFCSTEIFCVTMSCRAHFSLLFHAIRNIIKVCFIIKLEIRRGIYYEG